MRWGFLLASLSIAVLICFIAGCTSKQKQAEKHFKKGFEYQDQGNLEKAMEEYQKALELNPNYAQVYTNLGTVYLGKQDYQKAIENFKKVLEINYLDKKAHYNLGLVFLYQGELDKAKEKAEFLKSIRSEMGDALERKIQEAESTP